VGKGNLQYPRDDGYIESLFYSGTKGRTSDHSTRMGADIHSDRPANGYMSYFFVQISTLQRVVHDMRNPHLIKA